MLRLERVAKLFKAGQISNVTARLLLNQLGKKYGLDPERLFQLILTY